MEKNRDFFDELFDKIRKNRTFQKRNFSRSLINQSVFDQTTPFRYYLFIISIIPMFSSFLYIFVFNVFFLSIRSLD